MYSSTLYVKTFRCFHWCVFTPNGCHLLYSKKIIILHQHKIPCNLEGIYIDQAMQLYFQKMFYWQNNDSRAVFIGYLSWCIQKYLIHKTYWSLKFKFKIKQNFKINLIKKTILIRFTKRKKVFKKGHIIIKPIYITFCFNLKKIYAILVTGYAIRDY